MLPAAVPTLARELTFIVHIFSPPLVKVDPLVSTFGEAWQKAVSFIIKPVVRIATKIFLIEFSSMDHLNLVLCRGSWSCDNQIVVMVVLKKGNRPSSINLSWVDFLVLILDVLFKWLTKEMVLLLRQRIRPIIGVNAAGPFLST